MAFLISRTMVNLIYIEKNILIQTPKNCFFFKVEMFLLDCLQQIYEAQTSEYIKI